jgi:predicted patatin/cPLA2 family phospholipase
VQNVGLVLEGGGMRGVFTAGVLRYFMEQNLYLPYVIGVSAGGCNGSSYISRQMDRNKVVNIDYITHPEYISYSRFLKKKELFGMDFLFDKLPNELVPFDFETFRQAKEKFVIVATDCHTGEPVYFEKSEYPNDVLTLLRASSSLPLMAPVVEFDGRHLLDGGISDPIPIKKSEQDGNKKNIVILTRNKEYRKSKPSFSWFIKRKLGHYEELVKAILNRHEKYNETLDYIEEQEVKGNIFLIRPSEKLEVGRIEKNPEKLLKLYEQGYNEAKKQFDALQNFLKIKKEVVMS